MQKIPVAIKRIIRDKAGSRATLLKNRALVLPFKVIAAPILLSSERLILGLARLED